VPQTTSTTNTVHYPFPPLSFYSILYYYKHNALLAISVFLLRAFFLLPFQIFAGSLALQGLDRAYSVRIEDVLSAGQLFVVG